MGMFFLGAAIGFTAGNFNGAYVMRKTIEKAIELDRKAEEDKSMIDTREELKKMSKNGLEVKA